MSFCDQLVEPAPPMISVGLLNQRLGEARKQKDYSKFRLTLQRCEQHEIKEGEIDEYLSDETPLSQIKHMFSSKGMQSLNESFQTYTRSANTTALKSLNTTPRHSISQAPQAFTPSQGASLLKPISFGSALKRRSSAMNCSISRHFLQPLSKSQARQDSVTGSHPTAV